MTTKKINDNFVTLTAGKGKVLRRIGDDNVSTYGKVSVRKNDTDLWEEVPKAEVEARIAEDERVKKYEARVVEMIRQRYTADDELAIQRKMLASPSEQAQEEFLQYNSFVEECKAKAKQETEV